MANDMIKIIGILAVAYIIFGQGAVTPTAPATNGVGTANGGCNYAPTFNLRAQDKWDSQVGISSSHAYKINGGATQTFAGTSVSANRNDVVNVLWGNGNSTIYNDLGTYTISKCGLNQFPADGPLMLVQNTSVSLQCFDENNDRIDGTTYFTIGTGETASIPCRLKLDNAKKGMPKGAVLVVELNSTAYKDENTILSGGKISAKTSTPGAYSLAAAAHTAVAYDVESMLETGFFPFTVYVEAATTENPNIDDNITLTLYSKDCYENSDTALFECGVETEDSIWAGDALGTVTIAID